MIHISFTDADTLGKHKDLSAFEQIGNFTAHDFLSNSEEIIKHCSQSEVIITNKSLFDKELMEQLPKLKLICIAATGYNNVDLEYAQRKGIAVCNVKGYSTDSVAQKTFSLTLSLLEQISFYDKFVKSGDYSKHHIMSYFEREFHEISGKVWGIIGMGEIGRKVAQIATAFGAEVVYYSTSGKNLAQNYRVLPLNELLRTSDFVSIHAPLNPTTLNLISDKQLDLMKQKAILINVGRGGIVDEKALADALNQNKILGAGLDVMAQEPINNDNPLLQLKEPNKIILTPHNAWSSVEARKTLIADIVKNIEAFYRGERLNRVDSINE